MGVTIDNLQIEIQSNSTNAAQGIDALATSLEKLKKNGAFKTVSTNLDRLSGSLKNLPNVHQASNALRTLANSIEKLKGVGSIASITNNLTKLPGALKSLSTINLDRVAPQIQGIVSAVQPLTQIKGSGFASMVNAMAKIEKVTESLDATKIKAFADKVKELDAAIGPLSQKMTTIKAGFSAINSGARSASGGVKALGEEVNTTTFNLANMVTVAQGIISAIQPVVQFFANTIDSAAQWEGIASRFGKGFGPQAQETYEWILRLNEEMGINVQQFMQYSSVYATMLTGFGVANADAAKMALGYTELTYDIWAGYNDIYKTFDEAAEAVRSAIAGEVEPVRRAGFTIIESTLEQTAANHMLESSLDDVTSASSELVEITQVGADAFKDLSNVYISDQTLAATAANHGLKISLENATEAQKSYLRYLTLVDQAHAQNLVGTYAKEMDTAEGVMRTFSQQLKSLTQAFGSLFLPILVKVMPWLQAFVELLTEGVYWLANLFGVEIQDIGDTWKNYNQESEQGQQNTEKLNKELEKSQEEAKKLKNAMLGIDELNVISPNTSTDSDVLGGNGSGSSDAGFDGWNVNSLWDNAIFDGIQNDVDAIKEKMKEWLPTIATIATALAGLRLAKLLKDIKAIEKITIAGGLIKQFTGFVTAFGQLAKEGGFIPALAAAFPKLSSAIVALGGGSAAVGLGVIAAAIVAIGSALYFVIENWDELKQAVKEFFDENIAPKLDEIKKQFEKIKEALGPVYDFVIKPIIDGIQWLVSKLPNLGTMIEWLGGLLLAMPTAQLMGLFNMAASVIEGVVQAISGFIQVVRGMVDLIIGIFTGDGAKITEAWNRIWSGVGDVVTGVYKTTIGAIVEWVKGVIDWFQHLWDVLVGHSIVPDTIDAIVEWFTSLPGKILDSVGSFVQSVVDKFSNLGKSLSDKFSSAWESVKTWWSQKSNLASYTPSIGDIKAKVSSAWTTAKTWWDTKKSALKSYTPSIGSIYEKLKERWDNARIWWNDKKTKAKEYTPSIGSIYEKLYTRWKNARDWWNKSKGSMSYTPSIGSIVDKLKSAWNTAKSWWSKNVKLSIPSMSFKVTYSTPSSKTMKAIMKALDLPGWPKLSFAANGGMFDQGSMIWAGERGAEIVANAGGGKTGVMNVQQMQEAVYEGVYAAVTAAMRGANGGGSQAVNVYLDGRQITAAVEQRQRERGASIMGNEVYSY